MKNKSLFYGEVKDGKLHIHRQDLLKKYLQNVEGLVSVEIRKRKKIRSLPANNYYWHVLEVIGDELGYDKEEVHELMGLRYRKEIKTIGYEKTGEIIEIEYIQSTTTMSSQAFGQYVDKVVRFGASLGINILSPEEYEMSGKMSD